MDFDIFARLNAPTVWPHTVSAMSSSARWHGVKDMESISVLLRCGGLDFERDWVGVRVLEVEGFGDFLLERAWPRQSLCTV